jgi:DNA-binding NarL/FixJ family response regulator
MRAKEGFEVAMNTIIVADDHSVFRSGLAKILNTEKDLRVVAQCSDSQCLYQALKELPKSLLIVSATLLPDLGMLAELHKKTMSGVMVILENNQPSLPFQSSIAGGIIYRNTTVDGMITCVRSVMESRRPERADRVAPEVSEDDVVGARVRARLTMNEMRVLGLLVEGNRNKEIAIRLGMNEQAVKNYLRSIYNKTGVSDRLELALFTLHHRTLADAAAAVIDLAVSCN